MRSCFYNKRLLMLAVSFVTIFAILLSTVAGGISLFEVKADGVWTKELSAPTQGNGSQGNPYLIATAEELAYVVKNGGSSFYKLTEDIYLNDVSKIDWSNGKASAGYSANSWYTSADVGVFCGTLDGDGHRIYGLYVNTTQAVSAALFPKVQQNYSATIKNVGIESAFLSVGSYAAAFVGTTDYAGSSATLTIENSYVGADVTVKGVVAAAFYARGAIDYSIDKCYSLASINGNSKYGLVGETWGSFRSISNCYIVGTRITNHGEIPCTNVYTSDSAGGAGAIQLSTTNMQGSDVLTSEGKMPKLAGCNAFSATSAYPTLKIFAGSAPQPDPDPNPNPGDGSEDGIWNGNETAPTKGSGAENDPYLIEKPEELAYAVKNGGSAFYKLANDIYLNDTAKINWSDGKAESGYYLRTWYDSSSVQVFCGTLDGDGHKIYGLYLNTAASVATALFPKIQQNNSETIKNLGIEAAYLSTGNVAAGFVGATEYADGSGTLTIENCYVGADVTLKGTVAAAFYGRGAANFSIDKCYTLASVNGSSKYGAVAETWGSARSISNSYIVGTRITNHGEIGCTNVYATDSAGGAGAIQLTNANMKGQDSLSAEGKMNKLASCQAFEPTASFPVLKMFYADQVPDNSGSWDGTTQKPADTIGDEANPILIESAEELAYVVKNGGNSYYKLTKDIYLNDVNKIDWNTGVAQKGYTPKSWYDYDSVSEFRGTLDGDGHKIYGLYLNTTASVATALFPRIHDGYSETIKNVGIEAAYLSTGYVAAGFVGATVASHASGTLKIENCYIGADVTIKAKVAAAFYARGASKYEINKCYTLAKIEGTENYGMVGLVYGSSKEINNTYAVGTRITNYGEVSGLSAVYVTEGGGGTGYITRTAENMQGLDVLTNADKMSDLADCSAFFATNTYPILKIFSDIPIEDEQEVIEGKIWSGKVATKFAAGSGKEDDPYIISNGAELAYAVRGKGFGGSYFKLTNDIYLNDVTNLKWEENPDNNKWVTSTEFNGYIDGCGYIVYGLWFPESNTSSNAGLITVFNSGYIKNLGVRYAHVIAADYAAGIIGRTGGNGKKIVDKCFVDETVSATYRNSPNGAAGGIIGIAGYEPSDNTVLEISNCYSKAKLYGQDGSRTNGIIGTAWECSYKMFNCYSQNYAPYSALNKSTCSYLNLKGVSLEEIYKNIYTDATKPKEFEVFEFISDRENLIGETAKKYMPGLDFKTIFETVETSTPKLRIFKSISGEEVDLSGDTKVYSSGKGTKKNPFIISNAAQLRYLLQSKNTKGKYYKLAGDIYVNDTSKANWKVNNPAVWYTSENCETFEGYIEGNGYSIYGLFLNQTPEYFDEKENNFLSEGTALFPVVSTNAVIRNIHIRNSYLSAKGYVGSVAGKITGVDNGLYTQVVGCSADRSVELKGQVAGGLVAGRTDRGLKLYYCYFTGKLSATSELRGNAFVGDLYGRDWEVVECYGVDYRLFLVKPNLVAAVYDTLSTEGCKHLKLEDMTGENAKKSMKELEWDIWATVKGSTPTLKVVPEGREPKVFDEGVKGQVWSGYRATKFAGGDGSQNNPYLIETSEQMAMLVTSTDTKGKYYKLTADLKLNDTKAENWQENAKEWFTGITDFAGYFNGDGYVVSGLYYNTAYTYAALFPSITSGAVIEKLGITQSSIYNYGEENKSAYGAALVGYVREFEIPDEEYVRPRISMCFADHTVSIESHNAGGLISGCSKYVEMDNCYFTGQLNKLGTYGGQAIANAWNSKIACVIKNSFFVSDAGYPVLDHYGGAGIAEIENVYYQGIRGTVNGAISIASMIIRGENALKNMPELDYEKVWKIVEGGTPVLRCFANAEKYSCSQMPQKVEITFASQGGSQCEPLLGYPYYDKLTLDMLPTPTRYGYEFGGWYYFAECYVPVKDGLFPNYSTVFYAKWIAKGFTENFEGAPNPKYDYNSAAEHYKPGVSGYTPLYVNQGLKSMHTKNAQEQAPRFLLSYVNTLETGRIYDIVFWVCTDSQDTADATVKLIHANHPQVDSDTVGHNTVEIKGMKKGVWQKVETQITANTEYLLFETDNQCNLYFDDIQVVPTGEIGELGMLEAMQKDAQSQSNVGIIVGITAGSVVLLGAIALAVILIIKKRGVGN